MLEAVILRRKTSTQLKDATAAGCTVRIRKFGFLWMEGLFCGLNMVGTTQPWL